MVRLWERFLIWQWLNNSLHSFCPYHKYWTGYWTLGNQPWKVILISLLHNISGCALWLKLGRSQSIHTTTRGQEYTLSCLCPKHVLFATCYLCKCKSAILYLVFVLSSVWPHPFLNAPWMLWYVQFNTFVTGRLEPYLSQNFILAGVWLLAICCYSLSQLSCNIKLCLKEAMFSLVLVCLIISCFILFISL